MDTHKLGKLRNLTSIYLTYQDKILLLYREGSRVAHHKWVSSAGGHFEKEDLNDALSCCLRELNEELSLTKDDLEKIDLRYITLYRNENEIRQNYYFFASLKEIPTHLESNEGKLQWFNLDEIKDLDMMFTSKEVTNHYLEVGQYNSLLYAGISTNSHMEFIELTLF